MNNGISFGERTMNNFGVSLSIFVAISNQKQIFCGFCFVRIHKLFFSLSFCWVEK